MSASPSAPSHTPAPWSYDGPPQNIIVWGPGEETRVCFMTSDGPAEANARLIAAAPDLLDALEGLLGLAHEGSLFSTRMDAAKAAIAKASGAA